MHSGLVTMSGIILLVLNAGAFSITLLHLVARHANRSQRLPEVFVHVLVTTLALLTSAAADGSCVAYMRDMINYRTHQALICVNVASRLLGAGICIAYSARQWQKDTIALETERACQGLRQLQLQEARDRHALFRYINHEYRGPLNALTLGLDYLLDNLGQAVDAECLTVVQEMESETASLNRLLVALHEL